MLVAYGGSKYHAKSLRSTHRGSIRCNFENQGKEIVMTNSTEDRASNGNAVEAPGPRAVSWLPKPAKHDYAAAGSYLSLIMSEETATKLAARFAAAESVNFKAKDILRASGLPLLPPTNPDVKKELARVAAGVALSPCLIVRGRLDNGRPALIADGYHRICASNYVDEDTEIPVHIIDL